MLYGLKPEQFVVEDNGVPQTIHIDEDADALGLSLVVAVQCSRSAIMEFAKLQGLATMIDAITGGAPHEVALVSYGTEPTLLGEFSSDPDKPLAPPSATSSPAPTIPTPPPSTPSPTPHHCSMAATTTSATPSSSSPKPATTAATSNPKKSSPSLGRTNTVVDSVAFSPGKTEILNDLSYGGGSGPIGLLVMAVNAVKHNAPKALASSSGGEYINFTTQKGFDKSLGTLVQPHPQLLPAQLPATTGSARLRRRGTRRARHRSGLHRITVRVPDYPDAQVRFRESYWAGDPPEELR